MARTTVSNRNLVPQTTDYSVVFNGTNSYLEIPSSFQPLATGFCMGFWFKSVWDTGNARLLSWYTANAGFQIYIQTKGLWCQLFDGAGAVVNSNAGFVLNRWTFLILTFTPNNYNVYQNLTSSVNDTSCVLSPAVAQKITFGKISSAGSGWGAFRMKNITFQNTTTPWTSQERTDLYYRNKIPTGATQWSLNNTLLDQNGLNSLTGANTAFSTQVPFIKRPTR